MSTENLDSAITSLQGEINELQYANRHPMPGQRGQEGSTDWFLLRAKSLGMSSLLRMRQLSIGNDVAAVERYHRAAEKHHVRLDPPAPIVVEKEKLPADVVLPAGVVVPQ